MKSQFFVLLMFVVVALPCFCARIMPQTGTSFNVLDYGAQGNGQTDDSRAFMKAWQDVCGATQDAPTLIIPEGKIFMLQPVLLQGPCKSATVNVELQGTIVAPNNVGAWKWPDNDKGAWVRFWDISGLVINGGGQIDGKGAAWWNCNKCNRPTALHFHACENLRLSGLTHINSPKNHISIDGCNDSWLSSLQISAPKESPNTDGIDISSSSNVVVTHSTMKTGDDCIAINGGSSFINISGIYCGPGHGISIGSLGRNGAYETVEEIHVRNCTFYGTQNGARIKTWIGGSGYAKKITFEDIKLVGADNPVIIDQQYGPRDASGAVNAVKVSDVTYRKVWGTSACGDAVKLNCDANIGCTNIVLEGINITSAAAGEKPYASCKNAQGTCSSCNPNIPCLSNHYG